MYVVHDVRAFKGGAAKSSARPTHANDHSLTSSTVRYSLLSPIFFGLGMSFGMGPDVVDSKTQERIRVQVGVRTQGDRVGLI